jgi:hypothetical protein
MPDSGNGILIASKIGVIDMQDRIDRLGEMVMAKLEIVWRNPEPVKYAPRRHSLGKGSQHRLYILQEFVCDGNLSHWETIADLEVLIGGMAA